MCVWVRLKRFIRYISAQIGSISVHIQQIERLDSPMVLGVNLKCIALEMFQKYERKSDKDLIGT